MSFVEYLKKRCKDSPAILALPEGDDPRVLEAACQLINQGHVSKILFPLTKAIIEQTAEKHSIHLKTVESQMEFLDTPVESTLETAASWLYDDKVQAVVSGATHITPEVIKAGISGVGLTKGVRTVSGSFIMHKPGGASYLFADAAVVIAPSVRQLVDIAQESVKMFESMFPDVEPKVAFLSFSTKGSANHEHAQKMAEACEEFKKRCPDVLTDGEVQFDAAIDPEICERKTNGSPLKGDANCFIFPDLNSGNIAYKITQRLGGFDAYGPLLQGLAKPFFDLSRGSTVEDIVATSLISLVRQMK
jgi:phosphate acetyltransferase